MKTTKKILGIIIITLICQPSFSQDKKLTDKQREKAKDTLEHYFETLNLTDSQKDQYQLINKKYGKQLAEIRKSDVSKLEKLKALKNTQFDKETELKSLLTEEQYKLHTEFKENQKKSIREDIYSEVNLTESQKETFYTILDLSRNKIQALSNSPESRLSKFKTYRTIQKEKDDKMRVLLTKEQYQIYKNIQKELQKDMKEKIK